MNKKEKEALVILEEMSDKKFNTFLKTLPQRVQMLVRSGMANWRIALPKWYLKRT